MKRHLTRTRTIPDAGDSNGRGDFKRATKFLSVINQAQRMQTLVAISRSAGGSVSFRLGNNIERLAREIDHWGSNDSDIRKDICGASITIGQISYNFVIERNVPIVHNSYY